MKPVQAGVGSSEELDVLDALLDMLERRHADVVPDVAVVLSAVAWLQSCSAQRAGVNQLLRSWHGMLERISTLDAADLPSLATWFSRLRHYLRGTLPANERAALAQFPEDIDWMPQLTPAFTTEIERRLSLSPPLAIQSAVLVGETASFAMPLEDCTTLPSDKFAPEASIFAATPDGIETAAGGALGGSELFNSSVVVEEAAFADFSDAIFGMPTDNLPDADASSLSAVEGLEYQDFENAAQPLAFADGMPAAIGEASAISASDRSLIWIGAEERELTQDAIANQLLPLAQQWAGENSGEIRAETLDALIYQCELIGNVFELIGTVRLAEGMRLVRELIHARSPYIGPETMMQWCAGLLGVIDQPSSDSALLLASLMEGVPGLDEVWGAELAAEMALVRIGRDPVHTAARKREASEADLDLRPASDALPSVLEGMLRELPGNASRLGEAVRAAVLQGDVERLDEARRVAHTLKGDANTVGVRGLAGITHALEDILDAFGKQGGIPAAESTELLIDCTDKVEEVADYLLGRGPHPEGLLELYQRLLDASNALDAADEQASATPDTQQRAFASPDGEAAATSVTVPSSRAASVRNLTLGSDVLDHLQGLSGEAIIVAQGIDRLLENIVELRRDQDLSMRHSQELLTRLDDLVALRGAALQSTAIAGGTELDPLEIDQYNELHVISRQLSEAQADASVSIRTLRRTLSMLADLRSEQEKINQDLQRSILRTRMVPFGQIAPRLHRIARQTAKQLMKQVELDILGEETLLDAELLERIVEPMGHLIRNAIDHGLESTNVRQAAGKAEIAQLQISVRVQGDWATVSIRDDGAGLAFDKILARAIGMGLLAEGASVDEASLARMVLLPGFSTRDQTTEISGRGVGMDVVNQRVAQLRGTLQLSSSAGQGLEVKIRVPVTQTVANVVVARGLNQVVAIVASSIEQIVGFSARECVYDEAGQSLSIEVKGQLLPAVPIELIYRESSDVSTWLSSGGLGLIVRDALGKASVVLVRAVDEVRSVVVKPVSAFLPPIPAVRGITQLPDGDLAPVVDLDQLMTRATVLSEAERALRFTPARKVPRIVVADDSLSARRSLEQLMLDAGYEVDVASDGFETISQVEARPTAVLLLDMEMPRMNGLEVARNLRNKAGSRSLPIFMITSRTAEKHRLMAEEAGVTRILAKPVSEDVLIALVAEAVQSTRGHLLVTE